jgi:hypothetical protein
MEKEEDGEGEDGEGRGWRGRDNTKHARNNSCRFVVDNTGWPSRNSCQ